MKKKKNRKKQSSSHTQGVENDFTDGDLPSDGGYGGGPDRRRGGYGINTSKYHQNTMKNTVKILSKCNEKKYH